MRTRKKEDVATHRDRTRRWRRENLDKARECANGYYARNIVMQRFKAKLWHALMRIRRAAIEQGLTPYDG